MHRSLFISICLFIVTVPAFAYVSGKNAINAKAIYCPQTIVCSKMNDLSSCKYENEADGYWGNVNAQKTKSVPAGTYMFAGVTSGYHSDQPDGVKSTACSYIKSDPGVGQGLASLISYAKNKAYLEAYVNTKPSDWVINNGSGKCEGSVSTVCPLKIVSGFGLILKSNDKSEVLDFSTNDGSVVKLSANKQVFVSYDKMQTCWSRKMCSFVIRKQKDGLTYAILGSLVVDMDNGMKIIETPGNFAKGYKLIIDEKFNTLEIEKITKPVTSLDIFNNSKESISLTLGDDIVNQVRADGLKLNYDEIVGSHGIAVYSFYLQDRQGKKIGSFDLDVGDNYMQLLRVKSLDVDHYSVVEGDDHTIEISPIKNSFMPLIVQNDISVPLDILDHNRDPIGYFTQGRGLVDEDTIRKACRGMNLCELSVVTEQLAPVGTITINTGSDLSIQNVTSVRDSEIVVRKVGEHKVVVSYTNK